MAKPIYGFIGLGLIGGSIARGLKRADPDVTIMAYMRTRAKLEQAKRMGPSISSWMGSTARFPCATLFSFALQSNTTRPIYKSFRLY